MDEHVTKKANRVKELSADLNRALLDLYDDPGALEIKIEIEVHVQHLMGRLYGLPLLQVKLSEIKNL